MQLTGAQALVRSLEQQGVEVVFGLPGGTILPTYDPLLSSSLRHILVRHEQGAGHAAEGYAWATGRTGVCIATSGPGATNLVTALADAYMDSVPIVAITGQVSTAMVGTDAFQEADITGITLPITKHNELVTDADRIPAAIAEAFHIASTGRPGPVLVDIPKDIQQAQMTWSWPPVLALPGYRVPGDPDPAAIAAAAALLHAARRPVLYVGGGVIKANAHEELLRAGRAGAGPGHHDADGPRRVPRHPPAGPGHAGHARLLHRGRGAAGGRPGGGAGRQVRRPGDRQAGRLRAARQGGARRHRPGRDRQEPRPRRAHHRRCPGRAARPGGAPGAADRRGRGAGHRGLAAASTDSWKRRFPLRYAQAADGPLKPQYVVERLSALTGGDAVVVAGVGQHQMHAAQHFSFTKPRSWINSGGLGTMGFAVPAAMGAQVGRPGELVVAIDGDGCFQMTAQELATCAIERLPIKVMIFNNGFLGMVRQWQELFYEERYSSVELGTAIPDYVKLAEAYGCVGLRCDRADEVDAVLDKALAVTDVPTVVDFRVHDREGVFPMVPAGLPNDEIVLGPEFSADEQRAATRRELSAR